MMNKTYSNPEFFFVINMEWCNIYLPQDLWTIHSKTDNVSSIFIDLYNLTDVIIAY